MAKRKKKDIMCNTSAPPMNLDTTGRDPNVQPDSLMTTEGQLHHSPADSIVFYMRMSDTLLKHIKQAARERSYKEQKDITYQMLICEAVAEKYPTE